MGGGIANLGTLVLNNTTVSGNTADAGLSLANSGEGGDGGGIFNNGTLTLNGGMVSGNTANGSNAAINGGNGGNGGGINSTGGTVTLSGAIVSGNSAGGGAGGGITGGGNGASGGGILVTGGSLTLTSTTVSGNTADGGGSGLGPGNGRGGIGGGIESTTSGLVTLLNSTVFNNVAVGGAAALGGTSSGTGGNGGGLAVNDSKLTLTNTTVANNAALGGGGNTSSPAGLPGTGGSGGGIYLGGSTVVHLNDSTVAGNAAAAGGPGATGPGISGTGGGLFVLTPLVTLINTIVAANTAGPTSGPDILGTVAANFSLIGNTGGATISPAGTGNFLNTDPKIDQLRNNGGPTATMALLGGSPALDAGSNAAVPAGVTTDQRGPGFPRIVGAAVDIGAFEVGGGLSADERFVQAVYLDELGRAGSTAELDGWVAELRGQGGSAAAVAADIAHAPEALLHTVRGWYLTYLGRTAANGEELGWVNLLRAGTSAEQVLSVILSEPGSHEFYDRAQTMGFSGTADAQYVQALYQVLLNRTANPDEVAGWINDLPRLGRQGVALGFLMALEYRADVVGGDYLLLHRGTPGNTGEINGWVVSGMDLRAIRAGIEGSGEFFSNG